MSRLAGCKEGAADETIDVTTCIIFLKDVFEQGQIV
jgi:hypothetical protein